ncbi:MAG: hypothetical protein ACE5DO_04675 [Desulfobacterales bacterium]
MIFIGNFLHLTNKEKKNESERRHGEFNLIIEAEKTEEAIHMFKERIIELRESSDFFEGDCSVFFNQLLGIDKFSKTKATMLNYKSIAGDPVMPFIGCSFPSSEGDDCSIYEWKDVTLEIDSEKSDLFIEFKS